MSTIHPLNEPRLKDAFGHPLADGACVVDPDRQIGYVRLQGGPGVRGPESAYWDGWFNVTPTRTGDPLRGKVLTGALVQLVGVAA